MRITIAPFFALVATLLLSSAGCYYPVENRPVYGLVAPPAPAPVVYVPTSLVIVVEGECTEPDYRARRLEIVNYLIERGYIANESELVSDPANASRIIRAIVTADGFSLSVFNRSASVEPMPDLETTDILYPDDPYFIFGFDYWNEIGPRRLPPRPRDYRPHPRPPYWQQPSGKPAYDHDRHWQRPGQPRPDGEHRDADPDRRPRHPNEPRPEQAGPPAASHPSPQPGDKARVRPGGPTAPPSGNWSPRPAERSRPEQEGPAQPPASTDKKPVEHSPRPAGVQPRALPTGEAPNTQKRPQDADRPSRRDSQRPVNIVVPAAPTRTEPAKVAPAPVKPANPDDKEKEQR